MKEYACLGEFTKNVLDSKTSKNLQSLALRPSSLHELEACTSAKKPAAPYEFADMLMIRSMAAPDSLSYASIALFELGAAPRVTLDSRFAASSSLMRMVKAIAVLVMKHDAVLVAHLQAKENLKDMQDELGELLSAFFAQSSFPIAAVSLPLSKYDARDPKRAEVFASMCSWEFESAKRDDVVLKCPSSAVATVAFPFLSSSLLMSFHALAGPRAFTEAIHQFLAIASLTLRSLMPTGFPY